MSQPTVTVLLPVYNAERYLREAISSVLAQTYRDFELLLINDGSTDTSEQIILSYTDTRIRYLKNDKNSSLIFTLNRGIDEAKGRYIARMDSDDICYPTRLEKQVEYMQQYKPAVVACTVSMIDEKGEPLPPWDDDRKCITPEAIRAKLPKNNCLAHPAVMVDATILKEYKYQPDEKEAEDYDLWLRLSADGKTIMKIDTSLLLYRFLQTSLTRKDKLSAAERLYRTKKRFLTKRFKQAKVNPFVLKVAYYCMQDKARSILKKLTS